MKYLSIILAIVIAVMSIAWHRDMQSWDRQRATYVLNDSMLQKRVLAIRDSANRELVEYGIQSISTNQLLASKDSHIQQLTKDLSVVHSKLSDVRSSTTVPTITHDTVRIAVGDTLDASDTGITSLPFTADPDTFLAVNGTAVFRSIPDGYVFEHINLEYAIRNNSTITYYNESRLLHKSQIRLLVSQDNPNTATGKVQTYYIVPEPKWFQKWWVHAALGAIITLVAVHMMR